MNSPAANAGSDDLQPKEVADGNLSRIHRLSLVLYPDTILRTTCGPVERFDSTLREVAEEMLELMRHHLGIGLAAPQVGLRQRLIVCRIEEHPLVLTNLEVKNAAEPRDFVEGCLSLPGVQVNVRRPERIWVTGYDLRGRPQSFGATGLWARVMQHELDHLNGVLICDYRHPEAERCQQCQIELPAALFEEREYRVRGSSQ